MKSADKNYDPDWQAELDALADLIRASEQRDGPRSDTLTADYRTVSRTPAAEPPPRADNVGSAERQREWRIDPPVRRDGSEITEVIEGVEAALNRDDERDFGRTEGRLDDAGPTFVPHRARLEDKVDEIAARLDATWVGLADDVSHLRNDIAALRDEVEHLEERARKLPGRGFSYLTTAGIVGLFAIVLATSQVPLPSFDGIGAQFANSGSGEVAAVDDIAALKEGQTIVISNGESVELGSASSDDAVVPGEEVPFWSVDNALMQASALFDSAQKFAVSTYQKVRGEQAEP